MDTGQLYSLARDAEGGVLGGAGPADQGGIEDLAGAVLVTATGLLAHREREAAPRPARKAGTTPAGSPTGTRQQVGRKHLLHYFYRVFFLTGHVTGHVICM